MEESQELQQSVEETSPEEEQQEARKCLYDRQLDRYSSLLSDNKQEALDKYGFAYFQSLPMEERFMQAKEMGLLDMNNATDLYNLAHAHAMKEDYGKAIDLWEKALAKDSSLNQALFNIALALEKQGKTGEAKTKYAQYLEQSDSVYENREELQKHMEELA